MDLSLTLLLSVALAMDCFSVAICIGMAQKRFAWKAFLKTGFFFGFFQAAMPLIGWVASAWAGTMLENVSHFIAFALLAFIGIRMLREAFSKDDDCSRSFDVGSWRTLIVLSVATSIDSLAVGISYGVMQVDIFLPCIIIGIGSFLFSVLGAVVGVVSGRFLGSKAEIIGGIVLIALAVKVLVS